MLTKTVRRYFVDASKDEKVSDLSLTASVLSTWIAASLLSILIWGGTVATEAGWKWLWQVAGLFGQASIVAGGAFAVGTLFGFLFGIPRTLQEQPAATGKGDADRALQSTNTNLEQISDWLTKILVGVGLTQIHGLRQELAAMASYFAVAGAPGVTLAMILNFAIAGFLSGYLLTRLFLTGAFVAVERSLREHSTKAKELEKAGKFDAALNEYESALKKITPATPATERRKVYEGLIFNSLYEPWPNGFRKAIEYANQYLSEEQGTPSARILAYLAGAYGQQYAYEQDKKATPEQLEAAKAKAFKAAELALKIDPGIITLLRMMWDPSYPSKSPGDDDLEPFFDDQDFQALLGPEHNPGGQ
jgi:hypothetical protein